METAAPPEHAFEAAWALCEATPGWLTRAQAGVLWQRASRLRPGEVILEIGSHQGRSTVILARAAQHAGSRVVAVDPFVEGPMFGGPGTRHRFEATIRRAGVADVVDLRAEFSTRLRPSWQSPLALLYIDGKHDYWTVSDDLRWTDHLPPGADVLVHDAFSSVGVTLGMIAHVLPARRLTYLGRTGSLARLRVGRPGWRDRLRFLAELPWFARNVVVKVLLRMRLRPLTRLLGHASPVDPY